MKRKKHTRIKLHNLSHAVKPTALLPFPDVYLLASSRLRKKEEEEDKDNSQSSRSQFVNILQYLTFARSWVSAKQNVDISARFCIFQNLETKERIKPKTTIEFVSLWELLQKADTEFPFCNHPIPKCLERLIGQASRKCLVDEPMTAKF
jgi:hypothetical protein